jgi:putative hydrolase of the HAD superfamily
MDHHLPVRAVLWDADGVLQQTPARSWDLAVRVVSEFPDALTGAPIDDAAIRAAAHRIGLGDELDAIRAVWSTFDLLGPSLEVVEQVRAAGTPCLRPPRCASSTTGRTTSRAPARSESRLSRVS